jgi:hypothetical protein
MSPNDSERFWDYGMQQMENQAMLWGDRLRGTYNDNPTATG